MRTTIYFIATLVVKIGAIAEEEGTGGAQRRVRGLGVVHHRERQHKPNAVAEPGDVSGQQPTPQQVVASTDFFELTHSPESEDEPPGQGASGGGASGGGASGGGASNQNPGANDGTINVLVRLNRSTGAAESRRAGINALRAAAAGSSSGKVYMDHAYVFDDDRTGPLSGLMAATVPKPARNGLVNSGLFERVELDHQVDVLGWKEDDEALAQSLGRRRLEEDIPWGIPFVQADQVPGNPANPIKVCVADTGYFLGHEDLPSVVPDDVNGSDATETSIFGSGEDLKWDYDGHGKMMMHLQTFLSHSGQQHLTPPSSSLTSH